MTARYPKPDKAKFRLKVRCHKYFQQPGGSNIQSCATVTVAGLNPHDQKCRDWGLLIADQLPAVLASDVVGKISKLGEGVTDFKVGDRVLSTNPLTSGSLHAGLQEYAIGFPNLMAKVPDPLTDDEACTLPSEYPRVP